MKDFAVYLSAFHQKYQQKDEMSRIAEGFIRH